MQKVPFLSPPENLHISFVLREHRIFYFENSMPSYSVYLLRILANVFSHDKSFSYCAGFTCFQEFLQNLDVTFFLLITAEDKLV